jgi:hypothetical protein
MKGPVEDGAIVEGAKEVLNVKLLVGCVKFINGLKLLLLLYTLLLVFAMAALAKAQEGWNAAPASAEESALLLGRGVGMIGVMWGEGAPERLLKL